MSRSKPFTYEVKIDKRLEALEISAILLPAEASVQAGEIRGFNCIFYA